LIESYKYFIAVPKKNLIQINAVLKTFYSLKEFWKNGFYKNIKPQFSTLTIISSKAAALYILKYIQIENRYFYKQKSLIFNEIIKC